MIGRRGILPALLATAVLILSGCAGFATVGDVNPGLSGDHGDVGPDFAFRPDSPQAGATPEQIVDGFLRAGSGTAGGWSVAREFLAPSLRTTWDPRAGVTIDDAAERRTVLTGDGHVTVSLSPIATLDETGAYQPSDAGQTSVPFVLEQVDGQWRIAQAPGGLVLDAGQFTTVFRRYSVMYFDPSWQFLVPDVRWFTPATVTSQIAHALVDGDPSPWLAGSVRSAFPESASLSQLSVPVTGGTAQVELSTDVLSAPDEDFDRMQAQLEASLATAGVASVQMLVGAVPIDATAAPTTSTRVAALPLVLMDGAFGYLAGDELAPIPGLSAAIAAAPAAAIQVAPDQDFAGVRFEDGSVGRVDAGRGAVVLDTRARLVDPTVDPFGYVWSMSRDAPTSLVAFEPDGTPAPIADAWPGASLVADIAISRDGARIAAVVTYGGRAAVWVAGIVRDDDQVPVRLSDPLTVGYPSGAGMSIAWIDDVTLGILNADGDQTVVIEQTVGGQATATAAPSDAAAVAGGNATSPVRLRTADGILLIKRGVNWQQIASGVDVLATQQSPPR